jgi:hypothetical protein
MIATHLEHKIHTAQVQNAYISNITCYKTAPKTAEYEGKLKMRGGSQAKAASLPDFQNGNDNIALSI